MSIPSISVIIPLYNGRDYLGEALQSIFAQSIHPVEIIVIDDGSTDQSAAVLQAMQTQSPIPILYERQENRGPSSARNRGIQLARGAWIAFLDADDLWDTDKLSRQAPLLADRPDILAVWGHTQMFQVEGAERVKIKQDFLSPQVGAALCRREAFEIVGAFDETMRFSEDLDWFMRLRESGAGLLTHADVVIWYRYHGKNTWLGQQEAGAKTLLALKKRLERRRKEEHDARR
jgi:glycosyltransferase involved in cell wall biosynthesis